ncbi:MAG: nucleotidyltransferase family protein [Chloroflexota bacterium]
MKLDLLPLEDNFIRDCLASGLLPGRVPPHPPRGLDWTRLHARLVAHRLSAYFYALGKSMGESWPSEFREQLRLDRYSLMLYGDQCAARVQRVLSALTGEGMRVIVLKGWAHIQTVYGGDHSLRPCEDIDVLVHPRDAEAAEKILRGLDCVPALESWPGYNRRYANGQLYFFESAPGDPANAFSLGLHWGLLHIPAYDPRRMDADDLFARARPLTVAGVPALDLCAEDFLPYACAHLGLHHRFDPAMFRYFEIAATIRSAGADLAWMSVIERAAQWRVALPLRFAMTRIESLWPGLVPPDALETIANLKPTLGERAVDAWIKATRGKPAFDHPLAWFTFHDWKQRPLIFLQDVFPGPEYMRQRYGRAPLGLWPLLYFRRLARGLEFSRRVD